VPRFAAEFQIGRHLSRDAAIRLAIDEPARLAVAAPDDGTGDALLSIREAEVARLLAEGLSNKEIGARLFISVHTVDSHVRSILNKLGVNSRAQVAARMPSSRQ
jgi:DNA-binding CsgD family transcriptional regulator